MEYKQAQSRIANFVRHIRLLRLTVAGLLLCNALLALLLWHASYRRDVVLIPASLTQEARITESSVSASYLEALAMMLINDRLNITPQNVQGSNDNLLRFVDPNFYAAFKGQLARDAQTILKDKVASSFYVHDLQTDPKGLMVLVHGELKRWVGERLIGSEAKTYRLTFSQESTVVLLTSFEEFNHKRGA